jgi:NADH-quinone oxidoreductase subunit K
MIPQSHFLILGAVLFATGLYGALTRRTAIGILMSIELILNAANINLITFNKFIGNGTLGQVFALFVMAIAAASAVIGLVLVIAVYRNMKTIFTEKMNILKW